MNLVNAHDSSIPREYLEATDENHERVETAVLLEKQHNAFTRSIHEDLTSILTAADFINGGLENPDREKSNNVMTSR